MNFSQQSKLTLILSGTFCVMNAAAAKPVLAQGFGRVANQPYSGGVSVINNMKSPINTTDKVKLGSVSVTGARNPGTIQPVKVPPRTISVNLMPIVMVEWQNARQNIISDAEAFLRERDIGGGFRTSKSRLTIAEDGPMFVGWDGRGFALRFVLANNSLSTYLRTPTPLGEDFDPGLVVGFDLEVTMDINVVNNQLIAGPARVQPKVGRPVGKNVTGAIAVAANDLVKMLSGTDFVGSFLSRVNGSDFGIPTGLNKELARLNPVLQGAAKGGVITPGFDSAGGNITLTLQNAGPAPVVH